MSASGLDRIRIDYTGKRFGMLVAVSCTGQKDKYRHYIWEFKCDCGNTTYRTLNSVKKGNVSSCGCLPTGRTKVYKSEKEWPSRSPAAQRWKTMKQVCYNPNNPNYPKIGGMGIRICDEWSKDPDAFKRWYDAVCMGVPKRLRRYDITKDFSPENCYVEIK